MTKYEKLDSPLHSPNLREPGQFDKMYMCLECGAVVFDRDIHTSFHNPPTRMAAHGCIYSKDQIAAAAVRITCDRKRGLTTPQWIVDIARSEYQ